MATILHININNSCRGIFYSTIKFLVENDNQLTPVEGQTVLILTRKIGESILSATTSGWWCWKSAASRSIGH